MSASDLWHRLAAAGPAAVILVAATLALLALPVLRRLVPRGRRHRSRPAGLFLGFAMLLALVAGGVGTMGASSPGNVLQLAGLLALLIGLVAVAGLVAFDVVLPRLRIDVPSIVRDLILIVAAVAIGMGFLRLAGLDVFSLVTTSAVLTAVVGLALQTTIANVLSGLGLQLDRTLRHGEWIEVGGTVGRILEIGWRSTRVETNDGDTVFVPNSEFVSREVRSFARPSGAHRMTVRLGFHYRHPPNEVRRVLLAAVRDVRGVLGNPAPDCGPTEFGDSAVAYALRYWIDDFARDTTINEEVLTRVWYAARRAELEIPFPTHTLLTDRGIATARTAAEEYNQDTAARLLATAAPFSELDAERRGHCARTARRLEYGRGEHILRPGDRDTDLYMVGSGEVAMQADGTPTPITLAAGELLGSRVLSGHDGCTARTDVVLYALDPSALEEAMTAHPALVTGLSDIAARRVDALAARSGPSQPAAPARALPRLRRLLSSAGAKRSRDAVHPSDNNPNKEGR
jgi:small-conductance mechanosensitive channel/CRP-like cAMP-binding protein